MAVQFKNDVFISYRRAADLNPEHWVEQFCVGLRNMLSEMITRDVTIWRDVEQLKPSENWPEKLEEAIDASAIFLALFSANYFASTECRREFGQFLQCMKDKNEAGPARKLFPVFRQPLNPDPPAPREVSTLQCHEFYRLTPSGHYETLGPQKASTGERDFWTSLSWLAQDIQKSIETLDSAGEAAALGKVFVSCAGRELEPRRKALRADLQTSGYVVLPRHEYIWSESDNAERIVADLEDALLSVHLVSPAGSSDPDTAAHSRLQLALAQRMIEKHAGRENADRTRPPPLVWIAPSDTVAPSAAMLIEQIRGEFANAGVEYLSGSFEALKTEVYVKLAELSARRGPPVDLRAAPTPVAVDAQLATAQTDVAVIVEEGEIAALGALTALFADRLGVGIRQIRFNGSTAQNPERMKKVLAACPRCLVFWSGQPVEWLDDVLDHPALAVHLGRATLCVYIDGERTPEKLVFRSPRATVVDAGAADPEAGLRGFLGA